MKIHEYQAKQILRSAGIRVPMGEHATHEWEAWQIASKLKSDRVVVKAQIHAGGRGKGGGVKLAESPDHALDLAGEILGMTLVTPQTGPKGRVVRRLLIEEGVDIAKELYFSVLVDRSAGKTMLMASQAGGMEIEEVAAESTEKIIKVHVDPLVGATARIGREVAYGLGFTDKTQVRAMTQLALNAHKAFVDNDLSLLEINPLVVTTDGELIALDAKITIDDNALGRHPELMDFRDFNEEEELEILSSRYGVDYVKLDGNIGCMVNGAGLAMATMDLIKAAGSMPANFLDIKGGASVENVINAFRLLNSDPNVKAVLINIFGGIVRCDMVAEGILKALKSVKVDVPIVARIEGTNAQEGRRMLAESDYDFITADNLSEAAEKVVASLKGGRP